MTIWEYSLHGRKQHVIVVTLVSGLLFWLGFAVDLVVFRGKVLFVQDLLVLGAISFAAGFFGSLLTWGAFKALRDSFKRK